MRVPPSNGSTAENICLACGLCCNGVIFADLRLQRGDDAAGLQQLGLPVLVRRRERKTPSSPADGGATIIGQCRVSQPCPAYDGCGCRIYAQRPQHCRNFDCVLLKQLQAGSVTSRTARSKVRMARELAGRILAALRSFGDTDEQVPLAKRFRRTSRRLETIGLETFSASRYAELTLAFHQLNLLLSTAFYPGTGNHRAG